ncbi:MAG: hypothetical protein BGO68_03030 [Candidatus Amoebophilus sp. 36-38]|nr:MAG: hypothetical protein BGO68_03030 [Candidatus Amoebophilus sp. 36-38]
MSGISKLVIKAYSDDGFGSLKGEFSASINPANLKITSSVDYTTSQGMGSASMALRYNVSPPRTLSFKLLFDNTGIIPDSGANVKDQLDTLRSVVYDFQEEVSSPYYIRIIWGVIDFKGKLINFDTSYTMFQADGSPIRAEVDIAVLEEVDSAGLTRALKAQSAAAASALAPSTLTDAAEGAIGGAVAGGAAGVAGGALAGAAVNDSAASAATSEAAAGEGAVDEGVAGATATSAVGTSGAGSAAAAGAAGASTAQPSTAAASDKNGLGEDANSPSAGTGMHEVKDGDTVPSISKNALGDPNLSKSLGSLNGLDSLRGLASGLKLAVPFSLAGLLAMLLALAKKYGKKGGDYLKQKGQAGKQKATKVAKEVKAKV